MGKGSHGGCETYRKNNRIIIIMHRFGHGGFGHGPGPFGPFGLLCEMLCLCGLCAMCFRDPAPPPPPPPPVYGERQTSTIG